MMTLRFLKYGSESKISSNERQLLLTLRISISSQFLATASKPLFILLCCKSKYFNLNSYGKFDISFRPLFWKMKDSNGLMVSKYFLSSVKIVSGKFF
jgi:hypothetical protein